MGKKQCGTGGHFYCFLACLVITPILFGGCSHLYEGMLAKSTFREANDFLSQGSYQASLSKYEQIITEYPSAGDRVLFEMAIIHAHPKNEQKDYQQSLACLQKLSKDYPESRYRPDAEMMIFYVNNVTIKDQRIVAQQTELEALEQKVRIKEKEINAERKKIETLEQEAEGKGSELIALQKKIEELEQKVFVIQNSPADKVLIEKKERRLTLSSKNKVLKTYKIALGGNPDGPKERQGDNKTPEGTYFIDAKNKNSRYHLSLHISYPNEQDKKRAKKLGLSPGGDIMIHGIMNGFSWIGDVHRELDWTKGCIAVTDEEIEEIDKLVPKGTLVEIRP